ncbi:N-formylglutamate amidohydrolase [Lichenicola sp.]|uniref:N-formylglutamate amidohydrolase n=1 Tax=Lichenicola sp. TaxID=2804529 RepID=UPI003AFFEEEE
MLREADPAPVRVLRTDADSEFLLVVDHAGRAVPTALGRLGLPDAEFERHIAWDIGALGVAEDLSARLDATTIMQAYSRLVIDCNRRPGHATSIAPRSDGTSIPGNLELDDAARMARRDEIFTPYQDTIARHIDARLQAGRPPVLVAVHSFTPSMSGRVRPWHAGVLHNHDPRLGLALLALLEAEGDLVVGDNEPYALSDLDDYTVPVHGEQRGLLCVELEIRQDLIAEPDGQIAWAERLARLLPLALARCRSAGSPA